jgi:hypothetical protein
VSIEITHRRMPPGGTTEQHITHLQFRDEQDGHVGECSTTDLVRWIDREGGTAYVGKVPRQVEVRTVHPSYSDAYLRTYADGKWTGTLLALPQF